MTVSLRKRVVKWKHMIKEINARLYQLHSALFLMTNIVSSIQRTLSTNDNDFYRNKHAHVQQHTPIWFCFRVHTKTGHVNSTIESFMLCRCLNCVTKNPSNKLLIRNKLKQPFILKFTFVIGNFILYIIVFLKINRFASRNFFEIQRIIFLDEWKFYVAEICLVKQRYIAILR